VCLRGYDRGRCLSFIAATLDVSRSRQMVVLAEDRPAVDAPNSSNLRGHPGAATAGSRLGASLRCDSLLAKQEEPDPNSTPRAVHA
jgi:hypothetical protein